MLRSSATVLAAVACVAVIDFSFVLETRTLRLWLLLEAPRRLKWSQNHFWGETIDRSWLSCFHSYRWKGLGDWVSCLWRSQGGENGAKWRLQGGLNAAKFASGAVWGAYFLLKMSSGRFLTRLGSSYHPILTPLGGSKGPPGSQNRLKIDYGCC